MARLTFSAALLLLSCAASAHADGRHFLWRVTKGGESLYIAGSVHVLRPSDYPLPVIMEQAFSRSAGLVEELDLNQVNQEDTQVRVMQLGSYPSGQSLQGALPPALYQRLTKTAEADHLDMAILDRFKPWLVSVTLLDAQLMKSGYAAGDGADLHFAAEAQATHKPVIGLEQMQYQLGLLAGLSAADQQALLQQALDENADFDAEMQQMIGAWHTGDTATLERLLTREFSGYPEVYKTVLVSRNQAWAPRLEALIASGKQYFVIVGALHLVGPDGLLQRFKKDGYTVEQL
ncbi:MAG TPA: TraB/GumN family protein [Gammaproteobacteria bacterium]|nr:TraB/GumN family protein [Gammaproteobacteria bacterium]